MNVICYSISHRTKRTIRQLQTCESCAAINQLIPIVQQLSLVTDTLAAALKNVQIFTDLEQRVRDRTVELELVNQRLRQEIQERREAEAEVQRLLLIDALTGLYNRRGFFLRAEQHLKLTQRMNAPGCLFFIDVDGLKKINVTWGHTAGDAAIVNTAKLLKQTFRESDLLARLGGDEFVGFAPNCSSMDGAYQSLQANVDRFNQQQRNDYCLSISVGSACFHSGSTVSLQELIVHADQMMYRHKRSKLN